METPIDRWRITAIHREIEDKTGLAFIGRFRLGVTAVFDYYRCDHCGSDYPDMGHGPQANGKILKRCLCAPVSFDTSVNDSDAIDTDLEDQRAELLQEMAEEEHRCLEADESIDGMKDA